MHSLLYFVYYYITTTYIVSSFLAGINHRILNKQSILHFNFDLLRIIMQKLWSMIQAIPGN